MGSLLIVVGLVVAGVAGYGLWRGRVGWARIATKRAAAWTLTAAVVLVLVGGAISPHPPRTSTVAKAQPAANRNAAVTPGPAATLTPSARPTLSPVPIETTPPAPAQLIAGAPAASALHLLGTLAVKGRAPMTGYSRSQFGPAWADTDRNGCDTRNDILGRDLTAKTYRPGTASCVVLSGTLADPYTGSTIRFLRGQTTSSAVQIDHVVALGDAWQKGAQPWPAAKRLALANDPLELLAVDGLANEQKGDGDAATWLPSNKAYRCAYVARQVAVKAKYQLWVTAAERDAIARVLGRCPGQSAPRGGNPTIAPGAADTTAPQPATTSQPPATSAGLDPEFSTCTMAKAHGYGPYYQARDPEYYWYRDGDHDGVDCE